MTAPLEHKPAWTREAVLRRALELAETVRHDNADHGATYRPAATSALDLSDFDSFSLLELTFACEDEFGVSFESVELEGRTLDELIDYIVANAASPAPANRQGDGSR
ncbi:MAG: acyl carrier protein [Actinomycetota bacterium]|nr:acyl carrier protein [Actinomycetota bacterium]